MKEESGLDVYLGGLVRDTVPSCPHFHSRCCDKILRKNHLKKKGVLSFTPAHSSELYSIMAEKSQGPEV